MNPMLASTINEWQKLMSKKATILFIILAAGAPVLVKLLVHNFFITDWMALPAENINFSILDFFVKAMLPLYCFISAADLFTGEAERGTLIPIRPINRMELFISKAAAIGMMIGILLFLGSLSVVISSLFFDTNFLLNDVMMTLGAFLLSWIPLLVFIAFSVVLALLLKTSVMAISSLISFYLVMVVLPYLFPNMLYLLPSAYLDWYMQWLGDISIVWVTQSFTYLSSCLVLLITIAYHLFNKKEA